MYAFEECGKEREKEVYRPLPPPASFCLDCKAARLTAPLIVSYASVVQLCSSVTCDGSTAALRFVLLVRCRISRIAYLAFYLLRVVSHALYVLGSICFV